MSEQDKKRAGRGGDQGKRKRRKSKVEGAPGQKAVDKRLREGGTLEEACGILRDNEGISVSTNTMGRYARRLRSNAQDLQKLEMLVGEIVDQSEAPLGRDTAALARRLLLARALDAVDQLPDDSLEGLSAERLSMFVSRLERTAVMVERFRLSASKAYDHAWADILKRLDEEWRDHPDLLLKVRKMAEDAYEAAQAEAGVYEQRCEREKREKEEKGKEKEK